MKLEAASGRSSASLHRHGQLVDTRRPVDRHVLQKDGNRKRRVATLLRFWQVDYKADVWLNDAPVGTHEGGESLDLVPDGDYMDEIMEDDGGGATAEPEVEPFGEPAPSKAGGEALPGGSDR